MSLGDPEFSEVLQNAFLHGLDLPPDTDVTTLAFGQHPHWDSLGHMSLISSIEDRFGIALRGDEVSSLDSYAAAIAILSRKDGAEE